MLMYFLGELLYNFIFRNWKVEGMTGHNNLVIVKCIITLISFLIIFSMRYDVIVHVNILYIYLLHHQGFWIFFIEIFIQGVTALSLWVLTCIMFVFSAVVAYTFILSKNIIRYIKIRLGLVKPRTAVKIKKNNNRHHRDSIVEDEQFYRIADVLLIVIFPTCFLLFNVFYWYYYLQSYEVLRPGDHVSI